MPVARNLFLHEQHRWDTMRDSALEVRLRKITRPEKLACFLLHADLRGRVHLSRLGWQRAAALGIGVGQMVDRFGVPSPRYDLYSAYMMEQERLQYGSIGVPTRSGSSSRSSESTTVSGPPPFVMPEPVPIINPPKTEQCLHCKYEDGMEDGTCALAPDELPCPGFAPKPGPIRKIRFRSKP